METLIPLIGVWAIIAVVIMMHSVLGLRGMLDDDWFGEVSRKSWARQFLIAPVWPVALLYFIVVGTYKGVSYIIEEAFPPPEMEDEEVQ